MHAAAASPAVIETSLGRLKGMRAGDTLAFLGVPFAEPPLGPLRFLPPRPARPWSGVRTADTYAPVQLRRGRISEDCLYLNIWMPASPGPHPVLFWIYGGGNTVGATGGIADGSHFARNGVICVTPAYRVGALGFLDLSAELGDRYAGSGNNGLLDQLLALQWIRRNIAAFGGDPDRITVGGESAGAKDTCALMALPQAAGLFHQAIVESGSGQTVHTRESARELTREFLRCAGLRPSDVSHLRTLSVPRLLAAQLALEEQTSEFPFRVTVDGIVLERTPLEYLRSGSSRHLRLLAGSNRDESTQFVRGAELVEPIRQSEMQNMSIDKAPQMDARYKEIFPHLTAAERKIRLLTAEEYWIPTLRIAEAHVGNGNEAWFYRYDRPLVYGPVKGKVPHGSELRLVWDDEMQYPDPSVHSLRQAMHAAWVDFISGREPVLASAPRWPRFNLTGRPVMVIQDQSSVVLDPDTKERHLWDGWPS
ncbi:MAG TPA: carboxylesterase family protein [Acidobacteriaceae bacterium]